MGYIALYGGSFNPVHRGHLETATSLCDQLHLDKLLFMPNASPPHKNTVKLPYADRMLMLEAALNAYHDSRLGLSRAEEDDSIAHYTFDTLTRLKQANPLNRYAFIMGMDSLLTLHTWKRGLEIINLADIIVLERPGYSIHDLPEQTKLSVAAHSEQVATQGIDCTASNTAGISSPIAKDIVADQRAANDTCYRFVKNPHFAISSTQLRELIAEHPLTPASGLDQYLPASVIDIIYSHHFYGATR